MSVPIAKLSTFLNKVIDTSAEALIASFGLTADDIVADMREPGSPSTSPVNWDSVKQRKAYFASNGFGAGIPYVRKGDYERGWTKTELANGVSISNKHPAGAIGGVPKSLGINKPIQTKWRSKIHKAHWKEFAKVATERLKELPKSILKTIKLNVRKLG